MKHTSNFLVYKILNTQNKKFYIGSTKNGIAGRYGRNPNFLRHHNKIVRRAAKKYGNSAFKIEIVQECSSDTEARTMEQWWLLYYRWSGYILRKTMYNATWVAGSGNLGKEPNENNSKSQKKRFEKNPEAHKGENNPMWGKHHSEDSIQKMSEANEKYYKEHPEARQKAKEANTGENNPFYGKHHSDSTIQQISESHKKYFEENPGIHAGENSPNAKLNWDIVNIIRAAYKEWNDKKIKFYKKYAEIYNVSIIAIKKVVHNITWIVSS